MNRIVHFSTFLPNFFIFLFFLFSTLKIFNFQKKKVFKVKFSKNKKFKKFSYLKFKLLNLHHILFINFYFYNKLLKYSKWKFSNRKIFYFLFTHWKNKKSFSFTSFFLNHSSFLYLILYYIKIISKYLQILFIFWMKIEF